MSQRRRAGERVRLSPNSGFVSDSDRLNAEIQNDGPKGEGWCLLECGDPDCREWTTLLTEADGARHMLCLVSECQMHDTKDAPS